MKKHTNQALDDDNIDNMDYALPGDLVAKPATDFTNAGTSTSPSTSSYSSFNELKFNPITSPNESSAHLTTLSAHMKQWFCLYPVYINRNKSDTDGRKIPKQFAVENPTAIYIAEAASSLGLPAALEPDKRHPKDPLTFGRVRVSLKHSNGILIKSDIPTKRILLKKIAEILPEIEKKLAGNPNLAGWAAASRSEPMNVIKEAQKAAAEVRAEALGIPIKKNKGKGKGKKKR